MIRRTCSRCSRRPTAGSIAAGSGSTDRPGAVLPPVSGGLHCGSTTATSIGAGDSAPAVHGGLHCGRRRRAPTARQLTCSRRPRRAPLRPVRGSAPPATPVHAPAVRRRLHCGSTASAAAWDPMLPPFSGGLHCGRPNVDHASWPSGAPAVRRRAPLRRRPGRVSACAVLPPFNGGLHCGYDLGERDASDARAPAVQRRAPLRHNARRSGSGTGCSRRSTAGSIRRVHVSDAMRKCHVPADQRRAPCGWFLHDGRRRRHHVPAGPGGLHCGGSRRPPMTCSPVLPPFSGGLHCGCVIAGSSGIRKWSVLPPASGGLHCGPLATVIGR